MAMRAEIRILEVMTASTIDPGTEWASYELPLMGTYMADLQLSAASQYLVVCAFGCLCCKFFNITQLEKMILNRDNWHERKHQEYRSIIEKRAAGSSREDQEAREILAKDEVVMEKRHEALA